MSRQVSIRQTLVLRVECVVENACELHTVLLAEYGDTHGLFGGLEHTMPG